MDAMVGFFFDFGAEEYAWSLVMGLGSLAADSGTSGCTWPLISSIAPKTICGGEPLRPRCPLVLYGQSTAGDVFNDNDGRSDGVGSVSL